MRRRPRKKPRSREQEEGEYRKALIEVLELLVQIQGQAEEGEKGAKRRHLRIIPGGKK
jgi:hypothetical protein